MGNWGYNPYKGSCSYNPILITERGPPCRILSAASVFHDLMVNDRILGFLLIGHSMSFQDFKNQEKKRS